MANKGEGSHSRGVRLE